MVFDVVIHHDGAARRVDIDVFAGVVIVQAKHMAKFMDEGVRVFVGGIRLA